jgi:hypothetical protein
MTDDAVLTSEAAALAGSPYGDHMPLRAATLRSAGPQGHDGSFLAHAFNDWRPVVGLEGRPTISTSGHNRPTTWATGVGLTTRPTTPATGNAGHSA